MHIHMIIDHPWQGSYTHCVMKAFISGLNNIHTYDCLDLNAEGFNPVMTGAELAVYSKGEFLDPKVREYQQRLQRAEYLAFFFPVWWSVMPAALKGWMDKVLLPGFAFTIEKKPRPLLSHIRGAAILTTTAVPDEFHRKEFNNALEWVFSKGVLNFCGIHNVTWLNFGEAGIATQEKHMRWLKLVRNVSSEI